MGIWKHFSLDNALEIFNQQQVKPSLIIKIDRFMPAVLWHEDRIFANIFWNQHWKFSLKKKSNGYISKIPPPPAGCDSRLIFKLDTVA